MVKSKVIQFAPKLWRLIASLIVSVICTLLFMALPQIPFLKPWLGLIMDSTPEWYLNAYYGIVNTTSNNPESPDIIILDLQEQDQDMTRKMLADLLMFVSTSNPRSVGVDCTFANSNAYDSILTHSLIDSISKLPATFPIAFAAMKDEQSALPDSVMRNKGFVNFWGFYQFRPYAGNMPHLSMEIARLAGYDVNRLDTSSFIVNYRKKRFIPIPIYSNFIEDSIALKRILNDKIVLIGGLTNRADFQSVPFLIESRDSSPMAGTKIVAYMLSSVIAASTTKSYDNPRIFHNYSRSSWWENMLLVLGFMFCYLWVYIVIDNIQEKHQWVSILKPILLFFMFVVMLGASMAYTAYCFRVPNITFFMVMTVFIGPSYEMFKYAIRI